MMIKYCLSLRSKVAVTDATVFFRGIGFAILLGSLTALSTQGLFSTTSILLQLLVGAGAMALVQLYHGRWD